MSISPQATELYERVKSVILPAEWSEFAPDVDAINRLPHRERLVVTLYYYEGMTLAEIGEVLGVTESRVCQIHAKTMMSLRHRLGDPAWR